jgi:hypothetical protein
VKYEKKFNFIGLIVALMQQTAPQKLPLDIMSHHTLSVPEGTPVPAPSGSKHQSNAWHLNTRLNIITHKARSCKTCTNWAHHYMVAIFDEDATVCLAKEQCNSSILSSTASENTTLHDNNKALHHKIAAMHGDLEWVCNTLKLTCRDLDRAHHDCKLAEDDLSCMHDNYNDLKSCADDTINELHECLTELKQYNTLCH